MLNMYGLEILVVYSFFLSSHAFTDENCVPNDLSRPTSCPPNFLCDSESKTCKCIPGYTRINDTFCTNVQQTQSSTPNTSSLVASHDSPSIVVGIVVPLVVLLLVIFGVYAAKKYKLVAWMRSKINQRNTNYDEFMIGHDDDDPPLH